MLSGLAPVRRAAAACALALVITAPARAQDDADGLRRLERLTIGTSDQFLGSLAPDNRTLYFASNRNTTTEVYSQDLLGGSATLLFDESADVTWPRIGPDGKQLLYVSFRGDALGELCVRELPKGERRCLAGAPGAIQAQWIDARHVLLLARPAAQGDMRVSIVDVGRRLTARTLFDRNLTAPAVSPDGRWLVYTPVERYVERIGPGFAARAGKELLAQRIDRPELAPVPIALDAPGLTGQPTFSPDGRVLYFVHFISDSNQDGVIDGGDHGVLFRAPFDERLDDAPKRLAGVTPQQLTDAAWNCQYPFSAEKRLLATCARGGHLDIYGLPLDGVVPPDWAPDRLRAELDVTTSPSESLLLHAQLLRLETDAARRRDEMVSLIRLHLQLDEFEAAEFHARHVAAQKDKATAGLGTAMRILCEHRRALRARERGRLSLDFAAESRQRIEQLAVGKSTAGDALARVLRSEIYDVLGDKLAARRELEAVAIDGIELGSVLRLYGDRADAFYRSVDEREPLVAAYRHLADQTELTLTDRLDYARAAVRTTLRGLPVADEEAALAKLTDVEPDSELAFAIELARAVQAVRDATPSEEVCARIIALYRSDSRPWRRRAVMLDAVGRGWNKGAQVLIQRLAALYVDDAPKGSIERRRAARLYRRLLEDRAYAELGAGKKAEARDDFFAVATRTGSLESWAGYLDRRVQDGAKIEELEAEYDKRTGDKTGPVARFVRAYMLTRKLPKLAGLEATKAADEAIGLLRAAWPQLKDKPEAVSVLGAVHHERFLHTRDRAAAQRASALYLIALDLARRSPRYRAMLLEQIALLQAEVGNWRIALDYFEQREKLPFVDNAAGLAHRLIKARTLLHVDREKDAAALADEALAIVERTPRMAQYRALCLDRAALYNLAADRYERSLALYDLLAPIVAADKTVAGPRNRLVTAVARAAAALGAEKAPLALAALDDVRTALATPGIAKTLRWPHATEAQAMWTYELVSEGLRHKAFVALDRLDEAQQALDARRKLYEQQLKRGVVDEHVRALALVETQLAELSLARKDGPRALAHAKAALDRLAPIVKKEADSLDRDELEVLWLAAEVRISTEARLRLKLRDRLGDGITRLAKQADPKRRALQAWLEIYLGMLGERATPRVSTVLPPRR